MEVLITCDQFPESKTSLNVWNPQTGTKLLSLRGPPAAPHSLTFIRDEGFAVVEQGKPFIHLWQVGSSLQTSKRILCPGKPGPMALSPDGNFLAVAIDEKINVWQPATGRIVTVINSAHYRPVTVLKFTDDGSYLISGGQDGMVLAWKFIMLVSGASSTPTYSWADHSLPVNDIHVGTGGRKSTVFTVGEDRFLKIYSLMTGTLLLSVAYPVSISSVVADRVEMAVYLGAVDGTIYQLNVGAPPRSLEHHVSSDAAADGIFRKHTERLADETFQSI
jgi:pre-rRNA-processing protein IPI3